MKSFQQVVREIRKSVAQVLFFPLLLDGVVVFLALSLFTVFFSISYLFALVPAIVYTFFLFAREVGVNKIKLVERYYPHLQEKLTTAADYADVDDTIVDELHKEVIQDVKEVATSAFISRRKLVGKTVLVVIFCFALLSMTQFNDQTLLVKTKLMGSINDITARIIDDSADEQFVQEQGGEGGGAGVGFNADIFGEKSVAQLGDEEVEVEIKPTTMELRVGAVHEAEKKDFEDVFPQDAFLESSQSYEDRIPKEQQELVKNYFRKIAQE